MNEIPVLLQKSKIISSTAEKLNYRMSTDGSRDLTYLDYQNGSDAE